MGIIKTCKVTLVLQKRATTMKSMLTCSLWTGTDEKTVNLGERVRKASQSLSVQYSIMYTLVYMKSIHLAYHKLRYPLEH